MTSPFPGMDPYREGALWPDVHHGLAFAIAQPPPPLDFTDEDRQWKYRLLGVKS